MSRHVKVAGIAFVVLVLITLLLWAAWTNRLLPNRFDESVLVGLLTGSLLYILYLHFRYAALNESERRYRLMIEQVTDYAIFALTPSGHISTWNQGAQLAKGYSSEEILGKHFSVFYSAEDTAAGIPEKELEFAARDGKYEKNGTRLRKDGSIYLAHILITAIRDDAGSLRGFCKVSKDVTQSKAAEDTLALGALELERALAESRSFKRALEEHVIMAMTDRAGRILEVNSYFTRISGYSELELIGNTHAVVNSGHHPHEFFVNLWKTIASGSVWRGEICNRKKSGELYWVDTTIVPITDPHGKIERYVAIRSDVTEEKYYRATILEARDQAEQAAHDKSQFLANMSHEVRTPLTSILGFSEMLLGEELPEQQRRDALRFILDNGRHLLRIINDILDFSKIEAKQLDVERIDTCLADLIFEIDIFARSRAEERKLKFSIEYALPLPKVFRSDPTRLKQILFNLLSNAVKFTSAGEVRMIISFDAAAELIQFSVIDTGCGLRAEEQTKLFKAFVQADASTARVYGGTGLGLAISRELAVRLGGNVDVVSEFGKGSTFTARIATEKVPPGLLAMSIQELSTNSDYQIVAIPVGQLRGRILLVEDGEFIRKYVVLILERMGVDVAVAHDGESALDILNEKKFDLVLMDMQMPRMDGYTATSIIRKRGLAIPVIAITANAIKTNRDRCFSAGCDDFLVKPFSRTELFSTLAKYLPNPDEYDGDEDSRSLVEPARPTSIRGDEDFDSLRKEFVAALPSFHECMRAALAGSNFAELARIAHKLKGAGGFYGEASIATVAGDIEHCVEANDLEKLPELFRKFDSLVSNSQHRLETTISGH